MNKDFDTIFLQVDPEVDTESRGSEATWCVDQINDTDIEYIRSDIVKTALDVLRIPKHIETQSYEGPGEGPSRLTRRILPLLPRINLLVERWNYERKRKIEDEQEAREAQGSEITSMVRQSRRLSEEKEKGLYQPADHQGLRGMGTKDD